MRTKEKLVYIFIACLFTLVLCGSTMETNARVVGYWSFNNSEHIGKDSSPNHNHGELKGRNTAKSTRGGKVREGLELDAGSWLEVPHNESLNLKDQLTLMCWVKFADINDFAFGQRSQRNLIWKSAPGGQVSYGLYANRGQLELDLPLYVNNPGLLFSWLYVIDPKCKGQFINGIPDFPASCQRKFAFGLADSKFGNLGFMASMPGPIGVHAVHPTFFANFFPIDSPLLNEDDKDFLKEQEQDFVNILSHFMIGTSNIYPPRIIRHYENLNEIWFHFAAVTDGKRIRLYVDGREKVSERQGSDRQPEPFINSQEPLMIGTGLDGIIDEVMILDYALTEDEIKEAMELGKRGESLERFLFDSQRVSVVAPDSPQIYWTDEKTGKIQRANLNGTNVEDLITIGKDTYDDITLDMVSGKIYWTNLRLNTIQCANLDGTNVQPLELGFLLLPESVALDVVGGKMYWTATSKIQRANLDTTNIEDLVTGKGWSYDIALDVVGSKMYWTVKGKIQRANLDGTNVEDVVTGLSRPTAIALALSAEEEDVAEGDDPAQSFGVEAQDKLLIQWGEIKKRKFDK